MKKDVPNYYMEPQQQQQGPHSFDKMNKLGNFMIQKGMSRD